MTLTSDLEVQNCTLFLGRLCRCTGENQLSTAKSCQIHVSAYAFKQLHYDLDPFPEAYSDGL